jgi:hypothetical protein
MRPCTDAHERARAHTHTYVIRHEGHTHLSHSVLRAVRLCRLSASAAALSLPIWFSLRRGATVRAERGWGRERGKQTQKYTHTLVAQTEAVRVVWRWEGGMGVDKSAVEGGRAEKTLKRRDNAEEAGSGESCRRWRGRWQLMGGGKEGAERGRRRGNGAKDCGRRRGRHGSGGDQGS